MSKCPWTQEINNRVLSTPQIVARDRCNKLNQNHKMSTNHSSALYFAKHGEMLLKVVHMEAVNILIRLKVFLQTWSELKLKVRISNEYT